MAQRNRADLGWRPGRTTWFVTLCAVTLAGALVFLIVQQTLRRGADRTPAALAATAADRLATGIDPHTLLPPTISLTTSSHPFLIVYDRVGHVLASSGRLNGHTPSLPAGVLSWVSRHGEDRISWQPQPGVREAAVIRSYHGATAGYVLAASSLHATEQKELTLTLDTLAAWLAALATTIAILKLGPRIRIPRPAHSP